MHRAWTVPNTVYHRLQLWLRCCQAIATSSIILCACFLRRHMRVYRHKGICLHLRKVSRGCRSSTLRMQDAPRRAAHLANRLALSEQSHCLQPRQRCGCTLFVQSACSVLTSWIAVTYPTTHMRNQPLRFFVCRCHVLCRALSAARPADKLALSEQNGCLVAAIACSPGDVVATGTIRIIPFPLKGDLYADCRPHGAKVTGLVVGSRGGLVFSVDAAGVVVVSMLLPALPPDERLVRISTLLKTQIVVVYCFRRVQTSCLAATLRILRVAAPLYHSCNHAQHWHTELAHGLRRHPGWAPPCEPGRTFDMMHSIGTHDAVLPENCALRFATALSFATQVMGSHALAGGRVRGRSRTVALRAGTASVWRSARRGGGQPSARMRLPTGRCH